MIEMVGAWLGFTLTVFILSYLIGDNPLYRIAVNLLVGAAAALAVLVVLRNVLIPQLSAFDWLNLGSWIGWLLVLLLAVKMLSPNFGPGRISLAVLVGIGVAVSIAGALTGTLLPLADITAFSLPLTGEAQRPEQLVSNLIIFGGVVSVLITFQYSARLLPDGKTERPAYIRWIAWLGQLFMGVALGLMYGGALVASLGYLADRLIYIWSFITPYLP